MVLVILYLNQTGTMIYLICLLCNPHYIAVCGDGEESEWFLQRKLNTFHRLVNMLFGPTMGLLKPTATTVRDTNNVRMTSLEGTQSK